MNKIHNSTVSGQVPSVSQMHPGDIGVNNADGVLYILKTGAIPSIIEIGGVTSFNDRTGAVTLESTDVISALGYTPVQPNSPAFTGIPTAPTAVAGTSTNQLATTAFVEAAIDTLAWPTQITTLQGLSDVSITEGAPINGNALTFNYTVDKWVATPLSTVALTGKYSDLIGAPASSVISFNTRTGAITLQASDITAAGGALLASPAFTGVPTAPTAAPGTSTTQIATTAFVNSRAGNYSSFINVNTSTVLTSAEVGAFVQYYGPGSDTIQLPLLSSTILAGTFTFYNDSVGVVTITTNPTVYSPNIGNRTFDTVYLGASQSASVAYVTTIVMQPGDTLSLVSQAGSDVWVPASGSAVLNAPIFRGIPSSVTPTFGSNSTSIATTAYVKQQGWEFPGAGLGITASQTLTVAQLNTWGQFQASGLTVTLPLGSTLPAGFTFTFLGGSFGGTVQGNGTDVIRNASNVAANTLVVTIGQTVTIAFDTDSGGGWYVIATGGASGGVTSFDGRSGAIILQASDVTGVGGALLASPAFTGVPTAPTAAAGTSTTQLATTAFVTSAIQIVESGSVLSFNTRTGAVTLQASDVTGVGGALLASPAFTGTPTAPTASVGTNTTQLATTAFVTNAVAQPVGMRAIGNYRYWANQTLVASQAGGIVYLTGTGGYTITLPTAASITNYTGFIFSNLSTGIVTLTAVGTDAIDAASTSSNTTGGASATSISLAPGDDLFIMADGLSTWHRAYWSNMISPNFYGVPSAPTAPAGTSTAQLATTAFVTNAVTSASGVTSFNSRTGAITLTTSDVETALGFVPANSVNLSGYAPIASPTLTGIPAAPTAVAGTNTTQIATTAFTTTAVTAAKYYDIMGGAAGSVSSGQLMTQYVSSRTLNFPTGLSGSQGYALIAPTNSAVFTITVGSTTVGTITFAAGAHTSSFITSSGAFTVTPGQIVTITAPITADPTLATVSFTLLSLAS
jgi:hypothetical protein